MGQEKMKAQPNGQPPVHFRVLMGAGALCAFVAAIMSFNQSRAALIPGVVAFFLMAIAAILLAAHNKRRVREDDGDDH